MSISQGGGSVPLDASGDVKVNFNAGLTAFSAVINLAASSNTTFVVPNGGRINSCLASNVQATASTSYQPSYDGGVTFAPLPTGSLSITANQALNGNATAYKFTNSSATNAAVITLIGLYYSPL